MRRRDTADAAPANAPMRTEMIHRTTSEGTQSSGLAPKISRLGSAIRKFQSINSSKEEKRAVR